jgi:hypothetical protein
MGDLENILWIISPPVDNLPFVYGEVCTEAGGRAPLWFDGLLQLRGTARGCRRVKASPPLRVMRNWLVH